MPANMPRQILVRVTASVIHRSSLRNDAPTEVCGNVGRVPIAFQRNGPTLSAGRQKPLAGATCLDRLSDTPGLVAGQLVGDDDVTDRQKPRPPRLDAKQVHQFN